MYYHDIKDEWMPQLGFGFGYWKNEVPNSEILSYFSLGPKQYFLQYKEGSELKDICRVSGIKADQIACKGKITSDSFRDLLVQEADKIQVPQMVSGNVKISKNLSRKSLNLRRLFNPFTFKAVPYGWRKTPKEGILKNSGLLKFRDHKGKDTVIDLTYKAALEEKGVLCPVLKYILK